MNRTLPPGDCGDRSEAAGAQFRRFRTVPGTRGLVGRVEHPRRRETPPSSYPAARMNEISGVSGFYRVAPLAVLGLGGRECQPHFLPNHAGQEPAHRMRLPAACFLQIFGGGAARPLEQVENLSGFAAISGTGSLRSAFGRSLGPTGLLARLSPGGRHVRAACASRSLFVGFVLLGGGGRRFGLRCVRCHVFSLGGDDRDHHINHSEAQEMQAESGRSRRWQRATGAPNGARGVRRR